MSDDLYSRALALPPAERAELAHALMDSLYQEIEWDTGPGWRITPNCELSAALRAGAEVVDLDQWRPNPRRA
ncbi:MAG: hypothetical protein ABI895_29540 [Deltaproteobacteria bacterium]